MSEPDNKRVAQILRQAEFLNKLSALLNEYDASVRIDTYGDGESVLEIHAEGTWVPYHDCKTLDVDACIAATQAAISHAEALS